MHIPQRFEKYLIYPDSVFALSLLLFLISLALPLLVSEPLAHKLPAVCAANYGSPTAPGCTWGIVPIYWFGILIMTLGWIHLTTFEIASFAWFAYPLFILALIFARKGLAREALYTSGAAVIFGSLLLYPSLTFTLTDVSYTKVHFWLGYFVWEASLIISVVYSRALFLSRRTQENR